MSSLIPSMCRPSQLMGDMIMKDTLEGLNDWEHFTELPIDYGKMPADFDCRAPLSQLGLVLETPSDSLARAQELLEKQCQAELDILIHGMDPFSVRLNRYCQWATSRVEIPEEMLEVKKPAEEEAKFAHGLYKVNCTESAPCKRKEKLDKEAKRLFVQGLEMLTWYIRNNKPIRADKMREFIVVVKFHTKIFWKSDAIDIYMREKGMTACDIFPQLRTGRLNQNPLKDVLKGLSVKFIELFDLNNQTSMSKCDCSNEGTAVDWPGKEAPATKRKMSE